MVLEHCWIGTKLGTVKTCHATLQVREGPTKFCKAWLCHLLSKWSSTDTNLAGIIKRVSYSEWVVPIVAVSKRDGKFRISGDYKLTVNSRGHNQYLLSKPADMFATLAGGNKFSILDMSQAYQQLHLDEDPKKYKMVNPTKVCTSTPDYHLS